MKNTKLSIIVRSLQLVCLCEPVYIFTNANPKAMSTIIVRRSFINSNKERKSNPAFCGDKDFIKDKNGNRTLGKDVDGVTLK